MLEDIVVPVPALLRTCDELTGLFTRHGYEESVILGHAKDGNIHFLLNERFDDPRNLDRYHRFTEDMVDPSSVRVARSRPSTEPGGSWRRTFAVSTATSCMR